MTLKNSVANSLILRLRKVLQSVNIGPLNLKIGVNSLINSIH